MTNEYISTAEIEKIYQGFRRTNFNLNYSLQETRKAKEIMILSDNLLLPNNYLLPANNNILDIAV